MAIPTDAPDRADGRLRGLALCAGVGGLELGLHLAEPGYRTVCYVERDAFAAATLVARMADQALCDAPLWDNVASFDGRPWRGTVDLISAGYPCQPFSFAGKRRGEEDARHLWPHIARIINEVRPRFVFCENVEGHLTLGFPDVGRQLQGMGFRVKAGLFSAYETGASHWRRRLFILADADGLRDRESGGPSFEGSWSDAGVDRGAEACGHPRSGPDMDFDLDPCSGLGSAAGGVSSELPLYPPGPFDLPAWEGVASRRPDLQPGFFGVVDGMAHRVERSYVAGNGVCPLAAAHAWRTLTSLE